MVKLFWQVGKASLGAGFSVGGGLNIFFIFLLNDVAKVTIDKTAVFISMVFIVLRIGLFFYGLKDLNKIKK